MSEAQLVLCPHCGATNRVPAEKPRSGVSAVCGKCKKPLNAVVGPFTATDANFAAEVERSPLPVLLDMWAPWCGPCRAIAPAVEELAKELSGRVRVGKMNVDDNPGVSARFAIQSIPALLVLRGGREIGRIVGAQPKSEILRQLERAISL